MEQIIHRCECCGQRIKPEWREIVMHDELVYALAKAYKWCKEKGVHEFRMGEIKHVFNQIEYARFNDWVKFGGLVYRPDGLKTHYGMNMQRVKDFLDGKGTIPERVWKSSKGNGIRPEGEMTINSMPSVVKYLDENGIYKPEYKDKLF